MRKQMKKHCFISVLLLTLIMLIGVNYVFAASDKTLLKNGMTSNSVEQLQYNLKELGFFNQVPTAFFGDSTKKAVIDLQKHYGLEPDGVVGFLTFSEIERLLDRNYKSSSKTQIVIDPGHGGIDPGTSKNGIVEKTINLEISQKLQHYLKMLGYKAILTRDKDSSLRGLSSLGDTLLQSDLNARVRIINRNNAKLFVSIHLNSNPDDKSMEGPIVYYNQNIPNSKILANSVQRELNNTIMNKQKHKYNRPEVESFYVLRFSNIPGVLVETAFVTNKNDRKLLTTDEFKEKTAQAIAKGIINSGILK